MKVLHNHNTILFSSVDFSELNIYPKRSIPKDISQKKTAEYPDIIISSWKMKMAIVGIMNRMLNGAV